MSITQDEKFKGDGDNLIKKRLMLPSFDFHKTLKRISPVFPYLI